MADLLFYKVQIHCQENLINTDFVVMICFALSDLFMFPLQKLPEVLDLGDIDLDRKRLRKQLQVVRIMNCIWQLSITSFLKKKSKSFLSRTSALCKLLFCRFPKKCRTWFFKTTLRTPGNSSGWWTSRRLYNMPLLSVPTAGGLWCFFIQKLMPMF